MSGWVEPLAISAGALVLAGFIGVAVRHFAKSFRRTVAEVVGEVLVTFKAELDKRFDHNDRETEAAKELAANLNLELAKQFGGNGNGIRQAVNGLGGDLATLRGAFNQHIREVGK